MRKETFFSLKTVALLLLCGAAAWGHYRKPDGSGNNPDHPDWGSAGSQLRRADGPAYSDGVSSPAGANRPSARLISNVLMDQDELIFNPYGRSDYLWAWGQFIDHDMSLTEPAEPHEPFYIMIPPNDPMFDPNTEEGLYLPLDRSVWDPETGTGPDNPRQQINQVTSWLDASMIYGSDAYRADWLREHVGGRLKVTPHPTGDMLPYNDGTIPNQGGPSPTLFVAGDVRANEHAILTGLHTLFVREHNRLAGRLAAANPGWSDEKLYQKAREIVGGEIQVITFKEFLPALLGPDGFPPYTGFHPEVDGTIYNAFSTAAFRFGHSEVNPVILRLDENLQVIPEGNLDLQRAFFNPSVITEEGGIEPFLRGLAYQLHQKTDIYIIDTLRNNLFSQFDLASLNIQRGRDHGLPDYNTLRGLFGLEVQTFEEIHPDPKVWAGLKALYGTVDNIDPWVGMLAEYDQYGIRPDELRHTIIKEQFLRLRDGDRFWYKIDPALDAQDRAFLENLRLKDIIEMNTGIKGLPDNVFYVPTAPAPDELTIRVAVLLLSAGEPARDLLTLSAASCDATEAQMKGAAVLHVAVTPKGQTAAAFSGEAAIARGSWWNGVFIYGSGSGSISYLRLDTVQRTLILSARNLDLSGAEGGLQVTVSVGDYRGEGTAPNPAVLRR